MTNNIYCNVENRCSISRIRINTVSKLKFLPLISKVFNLAIPLGKKKKVDDDDDGITQNQTYKAM